MKYLVLVKGSGYGCDYTIGCNRIWKFVECEKEDLKSELEEIADYYGGEETIDSFIVVPYEKGSVEKFSIEEVLEEQIEAEEEAERLKVEAEEKALLAKLQEKYKPEEKYK